MTFSPPRCSRGAGRRMRGARRCVGGRRAERGAGRKKSYSNQVESAEEGCTERAVWLNSQRQSQPNNNRGIIFRLDGVNSGCLQLSGCIESGSLVFSRCRHWNPLCWEVFNTRGKRMVLELANVGNGFCCCRAAQLP